MTFAWPQLLWLLLVPLALLVWGFTHRRRTANAPAHPKILRAEAGRRSLSLVPNPAASPRSGRGARPWMCAGLACAIFALARPQWGRIEEPVFDQSREILLAIDLSRSMLTPDVAPSRLDRAKLLIQSLLEKLAGERVGLVVFSGTAFLQSPLSADYEILREFLPALGPDFLPEGGSNYGAMLQTSIQAFGGSSAADRFLIVLSDGESTDDDWRSHLGELKTKGIRVLGLGIGTATGGMIPDSSGGFVKDERGAVVLSKLESGTLQELTRSTSGVYRDASTWIDLAGLVNETIEAGRKGQFVEKNTVRLVERFQWPLALGLWCLCVSLCYEFPVRPRPRALHLTTSSGAKPTAENKMPPPIPVAGLVLFCCVSVLSFAPPVRAAATLANPRGTAGSPPAASPAAPDTAAAPAPAPLSRIVGRLSTAAAPNARDWAEFGRETVTWGSHLQSGQQPVPEGPVRDALQAVDLGEKLDPRTADWPKLREELEALLKKPENQQNDKKQPPPEKDQSQDKNQDQKNQDQQKQDSSSQKQSPQNQKQSDPSSSERKNGEPQNQPQNQNNPPPEQQSSKAGESAFGDMKEKAPPPPPPGDMQKVGGATEKKDPPPEAADPALAVPMQKLEQLRNQDSPARLFELMQGDNKAAPKKPGKDW